MSVLLPTVAAKFQIFRMKAFRRSLVPNLEKLRGGADLSWGDF